MFLNIYCRHVLKDRNVLRFSKNKLNDQQFIIIVRYNEFFLCRVEVAPQQLSSIWHFNTSFHPDQGGLLFADVCLLLEGGSLI